MATPKQRVPNLECKLIPQKEGAPIGAFLPAALFSQKSTLERTKAAKQTDSPARSGRPTSGPQRPSIRGRLWGGALLVVVLLLLLRAGHAHPSEAGRARDWKRASVHLALGVGPAPRSRFVCGHELASCRQFGRPLHLFTRSLCSSFRRPLARMIGSRSRRGHAHAAT